MLARPATRMAAWSAIRDRLPVLMARLSGIEARPLVEGFGGLCDATARTEVAATIEARVADVFEGRATLSLALASIDRCIERRAAIGDVAGALPR
jgi:hypothetical protein